MNQIMEKMSLRHPMSIIELSDDDESFHPERTSTLVDLEANLDQTLSGLTNISNSEVFLPIEKQLPYIPGELQETLVENEEEEVCVNPNIKGNISFSYPNFAFNFKVEPHPSPLDRLKVPNDDFVTKREK